LHENNDHQGIISCFNKGLEYCNSNYIARMDLDDLIHPLRFEKQMNFLNEHPDIGVISSYMRVFNELHETKDVTYREDFDIQKITMLFYSPLSHAGSIFRANVIKSIGYRDDFKYAEDYDLWYQIMSRYKTAVYPEFLYLYRTHSNQVTNARNLLIFKKSWFEIMKNLFQDLKLNFSDSDINYHIDNVLLVPVFASKEEWITQHLWFNRIILANKKSLYFNHEKLTQFIYHGYWLTPFLKYKNQFTLKMFLYLLFSETNRMSFGQKLKEILKYILKK
jgi:glycosyltransferase involved in cell wall biosynthesis